MDKRLKELKEAIIDTSYNEKHNNFKIKFIIGNCISEPFFLTRKETIILTKKEIIDVLNKVIDIRK